MVNSELKEGAVERIEEKPLTMTEVAEHLRCNRKTVERWLKEKPGFPKPFKIGRRLLWKRSEVGEYLESTRK